MFVCMCVCYVEISQLVQSRLRLQLEDFLGTSEWQVGISTHITCTSALIVVRDKYLYSQVVLSTHLRVIALALKRYCMV